jgi:hypothetical protein
MYEVLLLWRDRIVDSRCNLALKGVLLADDPDLLFEFPFSDNAQEASTGQKGACLARVKIPVGIRPDSWIRRSIGPKTPDPRSGKPTELRYF